MTVTRGERDNKGKKGRGKTKEQNRELMGMDNGGTDCGSRGWGWGEQWGEKQDKCNWTTIKKLVKNLFVSS